MEELDLSEMIFVLFSEIDDIDGDVILLHLFGNVDESIIVLLNWACDKGSDSLLLLLIDSVFQSELCLL